MPHVEERFLVHRLVLEDAQRRFTTVEQGIVRLIDVIVRQRIQHLLVGPGGKRLDLLASGPLGIRRGLRRGSRLFRIDATGEERLEVGVDARVAEPAFHERVETEGGEMPLIEHDRLAERDRPDVVRPVIQQIEERS